MTRTRTADTTHGQAMRFRTTALARRGGRDRDAGLLGKCLQRIPGARVMDAAAHHDQRPRCAFDQFYRLGHANGIRTRRMPGRPGRWIRKHIVDQGVLDIEGYLDHDWPRATGNRGVISAQEHVDGVVRARHHERLLGDRLEHRDPVLRAAASGLLPAAAIEPVRGAGGGPDRRMRQ